MRHDATLDDKIDAKVWKGEPGQCWVWLEGHDGGGYASIWWEGKIRQAYRVIYEHLIGPIPPGWDLDHECHNRAARLGLCKGGKDCVHKLCVRPDHLIARPRGDNLQASPLTLAHNLKKQHPDAPRQYVRKIV